MKNLIQKIAVLIAMCTLSQTGFAQENMHALFSAHNDFSNYASREILLSAFNISELDINGLSGSNVFSYIAADITEDAAGAAYISVRRINPNLGMYNENSKAIKIPGTRAGSYGAVSQIYDIIESKNGWNYQTNSLSQRVGDIAFCGNYLDASGTNRGLIGLVGSSLNLITDNSSTPRIKTVYAAQKLYSIIEIPNVGYATAGSSSQGGRIEFFNYQLNTLTTQSGTPVGCCLAPGEIVKLIYNPLNGGQIHALSVSASRAELYFYTYKISTTSGVTFDATQSFIYRPNQTYNFRCIDMTIYENNKIAIAGSTSSGNTMLNLSNFNGSNSQSYNISGPANFRNIQQIGDRFYLNFFRSTYSLILEADVKSSATIWKGIAVAPYYSGNNIDLYRMIKRNNCGILNIGGFEKGSKAVYRVADIKTSSFGTNLQPNESLMTFSVTKQTPTISSLTATMGSYSDQTFIYATACISCICAYNTNLIYPGVHYSWCSKSIAINKGEEETEDQKVIDAIENILIMPAYIQIPEDTYTSYKIYDVQGKVVMKADIKGNTIETKNYLKTGTYILHLQKENGERVSKKFIVM